MDVLTEYQRRMKSPKDDWDHAPWRLAIEVTPGKIHRFQFNSLHPLNQLGFILQERYSGTPLAAHLWRWREIEWFRHKSRQELRRDGWVRDTEQPGTSETHDSLIQALCESRYTGSRGRGRNKQPTFKYKDVVSRARDSRAGAASVITKAHILSEITRTAKANAGIPLGRRQFYAATGIKENDRLGKYWARWGDAIKEAGLKPNTLQVPYGERRLLGLLASFARELGRVPGKPDIQLKAHREKGFPHATTFQRLGNRAAMIAKLTAFCESAPEYQDVLKLCTIAEPSGVEDGPSAATAEDVFGYVYLLKSGRFFKIGRTNAVGRRERELAIQLPEKAAAVHSIKTDDPSGIEDYWHRRFADRRKNGEWFELTARDVAAFRRRKFM